MKKKFLILILTLTGFCSIAQPDSIIRQFQKDFEAYKNSVDQEFEKYKAQNDSAFLHFLEKTWKEFEIFRRSQPVRPKPVDQPVIKEKKDSIPQQIETIAPVKSSAREDKQLPFPEFKEEKAIDFKSRVISQPFSFFGEQVECFYFPDKIPRLTIINENSIRQFYKALAENDILWNYNIERFEKFKANIKLNDWGYYLIIKDAAENIFPRHNEQVLFSWYALLKSGYQVKVGYNRNKIFLLLPSKQRLFNILYITEEGSDYYLINNKAKEPGQLKTYEGYFTENPNIISFKLNELPSFNHGSIKIRQIAYKQKNIQLTFNSQLIDFFNTFPQCELSTYLQTPISHENNKVLDNLLQPLVSEKNNRARVDILLDFIQKSFSYKTDQEQFGKERYLFAEECLYYPYADCEDRTNLLAELVNRYTNLQTIVLNFPEHVTLAVNFPNDEKGDYVIFEGKKYLVCDPTFINAKSGMLPADFKNKKPIIIQY
jgi:hypothetical protein